MSGQSIGYIRVSSFDQNPERQLEGVAVDRIFTDKASGKDTNRPELDQLRTFVREGIALTKQQGIYHGRKPTLEQKQREEAVFDCLLPLTLLLRFSYSILHRIIDVFPCR